MENDYLDDLFEQRPQDVHEAQLLVVGTEMTEQDALDLLFDCSEFIDKILHRSGMPEYLLVDARALSATLKLYQGTLSVQ